MNNLIVLALLVFVLLFALGLVLPLLLPFINNGAPFVSSSKRRVKTLMEMAKLSPADVVADFGSGDGRIIRAAARAGANEAVGYEIQPALVLWSKLLSQNLSNVRFILGSFWPADLSKTTVVFLYQLPPVMARLAPKFKEELPNGARIVSNGFAFPDDWKPVEEKDRVKLYVVEK